MVNLDNLTETRFQEHWVNNMHVELDKSYLPARAEQEGDGTPRGTTAVSWQWYGLHHSRPVSALPMLQLCT